MKLIINFKQQQIAMKTLNEQIKEVMQGSTSKRTKTLDLSKLGINCANHKEVEDLFYDRCFKLNPISYSAHNTLEFRQHQGTTEYAKIEM